MNPPKVVKSEKVPSAGSRVTNIVSNPIPSMKIEEGKLFVCGNGDCAQLGLGDDVTDVKRPREIKVDGEKFIDIAAGGLHNLALTSTNGVYTFGCNDDLALGRNGEEAIPMKLGFVADGDIVQLAAGDSFSACLTSKGTVYGWGTFRTATGELGFVKGLDKKQDRPVKIDFGFKSQFAQISCGNNHLVALATNGRVYTVGDNEAGQLGHKYYSLRGNDIKEQWLSPKVLDLKNCVYIAAGGYHNFAINDKGEVYAWGQNNYFQCGITHIPGRSIERIDQPEESDSLTSINKMDKIIKIECGEHHSLILTQSGVLYGIGRNDSSQLGVENSRRGLITTEDGRVVSNFPVKISDTQRFSKLSTGSNHSLALKSDKVYSWGFGEMLALGHGVDEDQETPKEIEKLSSCILASAGGQHSLFLVE